MNVWRLGSIACAEEELESCLAMRVGTWVLDVGSRLWGRNELKRSGGDT
jgi:hypothetical protein